MAPEVRMEIWVEIHIRGLSARVALQSEEESKQESVQGVCLCVEYSCGWGQSAFDLFIYN